MNWASKNQGLADKTTSLALIFRKKRHLHNLFSKNVDCRIISDLKIATKSMNDRILECKYCQILKQKFLDAGIQDVSTSISIIYEIEEMSHEEGNGDESDKHI